MNLLIVDDEPLLIQSLLIFNWKDMGFTHVFTATSAKKAINIANNREIDLIISDIQMPGLTGLELYEQMLVDHPKTLCIYISGYEKFSYAQQAVKLHAIDFLTKPVKDNELLDSVKKAILKIKTLKNQDTNNLDLERKRLNCYLSGKTTAVTLKSISFFSDIDFIHPAISFLCIEYSNTDISLENIIASISNLIKNSAKKYLEVLFLTHNKNQLFYAVKRTQAINLTLWKLIISNIQIVINQTLFMQSKLYYSTNEIVPTTLKDELEYFTGVIYSLPNTAHNVLDINNLTNEQILVNTSIKELYNEPSFQTLFEIDDFQKIYTKLKRIQFEVTKNGNDSNALRDELLFSFINSFSKMISIKSSTILTNIRNLLIQINQKKNFDNIDKLIIFLEGVTREFQDEIMARNSLTIVERIDQLIKENIEKNISLTWLAEATNYHPVYLSKIYKEKTNKNIKDTIFNEKMKYAKRLLQNPELKVYEISRLVGYTNVSYFSSQFKLKLGMSPLEYRTRIFNFHV